MTKGHWMLAAATTVALLAVDAAPATAQSCPTMRKINIGVSVSPPNVVHTTPYVAKGLGLFARRCVDASIIQFEGGLSATAVAAVSRGQAINNITETAIGGGVKAKQIWGLAPRMPQHYVVAESVKTAADLKGKRMSAAAGGVGSLNWRVGREVLKTAGLTVDDVQFVSQGTAGRLPGLITGQIEGVALHPEDVYLAQQQKPGVHSLVVFAELLPDYYFNAYGASDGMIAAERATLVDAIAAMMEANRLMYSDAAKVIPHIMQATEKPQPAVEFAVAQLTKNCVWSVNTGVNRKSTEWSIQNAVENGDIEPAKKPTFEQVVDESLALEAMAKIGGRATFGACKD